MWILVAVIGLQIARFVVCKTCESSLPSMELELLIPPSNFTTFTFPTDQKCLKEYVVESVCPEVGLHSEAMCNILINHVSRMASFNTSWVSLGVNYIQFVSQAVSDDAVFATFKDSVHYSSILENCLTVEGLHHVWKVHHQRPDMLVNEYLLDLLAQNNLLGSPSLTDFSIYPTNIRADNMVNSDIGPIRYGRMIDAANLLPKGRSTFSPTTLRYLGVVSSLEALLHLQFGHDRSGIAYGRGSSMTRSQTVSASSETETSGVFSIAEIGVGYGGQAQAIFARAVSLSQTIEDEQQWGRLQYHFFDLQPALQLTDKYLARLTTTITPRNQLHFRGSLGAGASGVTAESKATGWIVFDHEQQLQYYDLCLSNFAFSEFSFAVQQLYVHEVLMKCMRGFMQYNTLGETNNAGLTVEEYREFLWRSVTSYFQSVWRDIDKCQKNSVSIVSECNELAADGSSSSSNSDSNLGCIKEYVNVWWDFSECVVH